MINVFKEQFQKIFTIKTKEIDEDFQIEFSGVLYGPYDKKFGCKECYYNNEIRDRGSYLFPYKNKKFNNTEIFLENENILICTSKDKGFIDIINLHSEKVQRIFCEEVNLIYNAGLRLVINAKIDGVWKTLKLDISSLEIKEEIKEKLLAFFKLVYNENELKWYRLDVSNNRFHQKLIDIGNIIPNEFNRKSCSLNDSYISEREENYSKKYIKIYEKSCEEINPNNINFINNQNYVIDLGLRKEVLYKRNNVHISQLAGYVVIFLLIFIIFLLTSYYFLLFIDILVVVDLMLRINKYGFDLFNTKVYRINLRKKIETKDFIFIEK